MAGVYVHIPFCASRCSYCDFYSTLRLAEAGERYVEAVVAEARLRSGELHSAAVKTLYLGGGTPSQLPLPLLEHLINGLRASIDLTAVEEFTIEANPDDTARVMRATYARAFIYDEFKGDEDKAEELYKEIIEKYPNTEYAKQAQANLGMRVTAQTPEDKAKERFLHAESLWTLASEIPLDQMERVDSAYAEAFAAYDSVYQEFPETQTGVQALYMKAIYFQMNPERVDSAMAVYRELSMKHSGTPWGKEAAKFVNARRNNDTDAMLERLRKRVKQSEEHINQLSKQYYESMSKPPEEKKAEVKSKEDEVLENTYNSMYDFE